MPNLTTSILWCLHAVLLHAAAASGMARPRLSCATLSPCGSASLARTTSMSPQARAAWRGCSGASQGEESEGSTGQCGAVQGSTGLARNLHLHGVAPRSMQHVLPPSTLYCPLCCRYGEAEGLYREVLGTREALLPDCHPKPVLLPHCTAPSAAGTAKPRGCTARRLALGRRCCPTATLSLPTRATASASASGGWGGTVRRKRCTGGRWRYGEGRSVSWSVYVAVDWLVGCKGTDYCGINAISCRDDHGATGEGRGRETKA